MSALYVVLLAVVASGFVAMLWLRREGDRSWKAHQRRRIGVRLTIDATQLNAAMRLAVRNMADFQRSMTRINEAMRQDGTNMSRLRALADELAPKRKEESP